MPVQRCIVVPCQYPQIAAKMITRLHRLAVIAYVFLVPAFLICCDKEQGSTGPLQQEMLAGTWVLESNTNGIYEYVRSSRLAANRPGLIFRPNGRMIERKVTGRSDASIDLFENYEGNWNSNEDKTVKITSGNWVEATDYKIEVLAVSKERLTIKTL